MRQNKQGKSGASKAAAEADNKVAAESATSAFEDKRPVSAGQNVLQQMQTSTGQRQGRAVAQKMADAKAPVPAIQAITTDPMAASAEVEKVEGFEARYINPGGAIVAADLGKLEEVRAALDIIRGAYENDENNRALVERCARLLNVIPVWMNLLDDNDARGN